MRSLFASQGRVPAMGRTIRKPKTPDDHAGVSSPTPWPIPKEVRRAPSTRATICCPALERGTIAPIDVCDAGWVGGARVYKNCLQLHKQFL